MRCLCVLVVALMLILFAGVALADVPGTMNVQGRLTDPAGEPAPGRYDFIFKIFDAYSGGHELWPHDTDQELVAVDVDSSGLWNATIGEGTPIPPSIYSDSSMWLQIVVDGKEPVVFPRVKLQSGPFSFRAAWSQEADLARGLTPNTVGSSQIVNGSIQLHDIGPNGAIEGDIIQYQGGAWSVVPGSSGDGYVLKTGDDMTGSLYLNGGDGITDVELSTPTGDWGQVIASHGPNEYVRLLSKDAFEHPGIDVYENQLRATISSSAPGANLYLYDTMPVLAPTVVLNSALEGGGSVELSDTSRVPRIGLYAGEWDEGNASVYLPADAINRTEIWDEPGVAQDVDNTSSINLTGTGHNLISHSITIPRSGYVMATASAQLQFTHVSGFTSAASLGLSQTSGSLTGEQERTEQIAINATTGVYTRVVTVQKMFEYLSDGTQTIYFVGNKVSGAPTVSKFTLSLVYFPTSYGDFED